jgi:Fe-S-cluster-containing dehydrogenase component
LLDDLLREQQEMTAVEQFSQFHESAGEPLLRSHYRELIPATPPAAGEQYAFEVNLDDCSGCKACVAACHNLNGLDEDEQWRSVGLIHGAEPAAPVQQHVTTACHHCIEPGCLAGCPVMAYDKDPLTGIVRHLDDQCIGCQYCMLMCPYEVPQYNAAKGIVRKCDMCSSRLSVGEAPACVQSCPHEAIRIATVSTSTASAESQLEAELPGAPDPQITRPTTRFKSSRSFPSDMLPADHAVARPQHAHWPLITMLVLTQLSVGAFTMPAMLAWLSASGAMPSPSHDILQLVAFAVGMLGMTAAIFHLGRPFYAFRALLGLRTS